MRLMAAAGIGKQHADFKEFFNHVYRGTIFALVRFSPSILPSRFTKNSTLTEDEDEECGHCS